MSEQIVVTSISKEDKYNEIFPQIRSIVEGEDDIIANMANVSAILKEVFSFFWVGFYRVDNDDLLLGPFQGPLACMRIKKGRGVCGSAWAESKTLIVPNVDAFPGHIACSSISKSEIVVPVMRSGVVVAVLDVDSENYNSFDEVDKFHLEKICTLI